MKRSHGRAGSASQDIIDDENDNDGIDVDKLLPPYRPVVSAQSVDPLSQPQVSVFGVWFSLQHLDWMVIRTPSMAIVNDLYL